MADKPAWTRRAGETKAAFAAFQLYLQHGSIDAAWRASNPQQNSNAKRASGQWGIWAGKYEWVARAAAYADYLAERKRLLWEQRRDELQERDWAQADALRAIVDSALPNADQFIQRKTTTIRGTPTLMDANGQIVRPGTPDREIVTLAFDITGLSKVLTDASKLQRLATGDSTENIQLSGAALIAAIERQLARVADGGKAPILDSPEPTADGDDRAA